MGAGKKGFRAGVLRSRKSASALTLLSPIVIVLGLDLARRGRHLLGLDPLHALGFLGSSALSGATWAALLATAARRRGVLRHVAAGAFCFFFGFALAVQSAFFRTYHFYCAHDAMLEHRAFFSMWTCALPLDRRSMLGLYLPVSLLLAASLVVAARRFVRPSRRVRRDVPVLAFALCAAQALVPASYRRWQSSSFDHIYFNAMRVSLREQVPYTRQVPVLRTKRRHPEEVPPIHPAAGPPRNVILILQESVREDVVCSEYEPECRRAGRAVNAVLPDRLGLLKMRSVASSTVISMSVLLSGLAPTESFETLHTTPYLFGFARAAGYSTAYWTSQHVMLFGMRFIAQNEPLDELVVGTHLDIAADGDSGANDGLLTDRVIHDLPSLKEPFFAVVQYANVHFPYIIDERDAPYGEGGSPKKAQWKRYQNAVYASEGHVARLAQALRDSEAGKRTVIVYTSDHGEAFWEHSWEGHTKSVLEPEVRVPAWLWAAPGVLDDAERENLRRARPAPTYHVDLAPTMLDLMRIWDAPEVAKYREKMPGHPLTRGERTTEPVAMTNCSWIWQCKNPSIGLMQFPLKLEAHGRMKRFSCFDVRSDAKEENDLGEQGCAELLPRAREIFGYMPSDVVPDHDPPR